MKIDLYLAHHGFFHHRHGAWGWLIGWLATGSMAVGVAALIITLSVMSGFREDIRSKILGVQPHIILTTFSNIFTPEENKVQKVFDESKAIKSWSFYISGQGLLGASSNSSGAMIKGVDLDREPSVTELDKKIIGGSWVDLGVISDGKPSIFLGAELARNIGARVGETVWIIVPEALKIPTMNMPKAHRFFVKGLIQTGLYDYDSSLAVVNLPSAQVLFDMPSRVSGIGIRVKNPDDSVAISKHLQDQFAGEFWVRSWLSLNKNLFSALKLEKTVMFIILTLVTLVASVMIISNLLLMITQKVKDIGILRAMGADKSVIRRWFLFHGLLSGLIGNTVGIVLGVGISLILSKTNFIHLPPDVYYIDKLPINIAWTDIGLVMLASSIIVLLASLIPANRAARLNPIEAIRYG